jgi:RNA polymerase sigma factor (sigma-70 family)
MFDRVVILFSGENLKPDTLLFMKSTIQADTASPEQPILRARARGEVSTEVAFDQFYALYAPIVRGWAAISAKKDDAEDIFQDVWSIFYRRWRNWRFLPEMEVPEAKPVLSFLYRTFRFLLEGYRRKALLKHEPLEEAALSGIAVESTDLVRQVEVSRCLDIARRIFSSEEMDILMAKLAGIPAREIAAILSITEAMVDHRFRNSIARLKKHLKPVKKTRAKNSHG